MAGPRLGGGATQGDAEAPEAMASPVRAWLRAFGPATLTDLTWWCGATQRTVRAALAVVAAVPVGIEGGDRGFVLPDDLEPEPAPEPWAALLPGLDPTTMGWNERDWYLGEHAGRLFDLNVNAGPTAWWDGRVVGGWHQEADGTVRLDLLEPVTRRGTQALQVEADRLTGWFDGTVVRWGFPAPLVTAATR